ncbi:uncharacterized protein LOC118734409 [Rhagoletis pomonella]|uniref:uncharacterized protein LOC118734409 n=1 Tax=Rhagoletis pomonella TaxID=28610 RepID=UPI00177CACC0|nr:uncharacterized protein LOC118734409 [Rhagoletis pomonella]
MPFVLLLFQIVAGLTLLLFVIHYIYYIINAIAGDLQLQQQQVQQQQQVLQLQQNVNLPQQLENPNSLKKYRYQRIPVASGRKSNFFKSTTATTTGEKMQTSDDAKFIKKRWKGGTIEPHPTDKALIVNYQLEATVFGEQSSNPMIEEKKLKPLNCTTGLNIGQKIVHI